jgi:uracil-DNA glycosylase
MPQPLSELVASDWAVALEPVAETIAELGEFLRAETAAGRRYLPAGDRVLRAFQRPLADVRVLIVGQDPYPTPGHPVGLAFSVEHAVRPVPRSLQNIYRELHDDLGVPIADHGDLSAWADHGVMLLNRVLTVQAGASGSHRGKGWEAVTDAAIRALVARGGPLVAILWGRDAAGLAPLLGDTPRIQSAHPSPLSANAGFFGSRPFSRANESLAAQGSAPVDWSLGSSS